MLTTKMNYFTNVIAAGLIFGHKLEQPNRQNAKMWLDRIENDLSPENLSCDGELRGAQLLSKRATLEAALKYVRTLLPNDGDRFMGFADQFSLRAQYNKAKRERTQQRETKLIAAVQDGFKVGARILISNGTTGQIVKINRTRVKVKGDDGRMWSVPPRCMTLLKVR